jgi:hypothetical protein
MNTEPAPPNKYPFYPKPSLPIEFLFLKTHDLIVAIDQVNGQQIIIVSPCTP